MIKYNSRGFVWGNHWGGSQGGYKAHELSDYNSIDELIDKAEKRDIDGSLDDGMGFESLEGAVLGIDIIDTREIDGKKFSNTETEIHVIGNVPEEMVDEMSNRL
jgi:hypothetical protein